jgi:hypothetical protein
MNLTLLLLSSLADVVPVVEVPIGGRPVAAFELETDPDLDYQLFLLYDGKLEQRKGRKTQITRVGSVEVMHAPTEGLVRALEIEDKFVRDHAERMLFQQGEHAFDALELALSSSHSEVVSRVLDVVGPTADPRFLDRIRSCFKHSSEQVRMHALSAYGCYETDDVVEVCARVFQKDRSMRVHHEAVGLLAASKDLRAVDEILGALPPETEDDGVQNGLRYSMFSALRKLTSQKFGRNEEHWRSWWMNHRERLLADRNAKPPKVPNLPAGLKLPTQGDRKVMLPKPPDPQDS